MRAHLARQELRDHLDVARLVDHLARRVPLLVHLVADVHELAAELERGLLAVQELREHVVELVERGRLLRRLVLARQRAGLRQQRGLRVQHPVVLADRQRPVEVASPRSTARPCPSRRARAAPRPRCRTPRSSGSSSGTSLSILPRRRAISASSTNSITSKLPKRLRCDSSSFFMTGDSPSWARVRAREPVRAACLDLALAARDGFGGEERRAEDGLAELAGREVVDGGADQRSGRRRARRPGGARRGRRPRRAAPRRAPTRRSMRASTSASAGRLVRRSSSSSKSERSSRRAVVGCSASASISASTQRSMRASTLPGAASAGSTRSSMRSNTRSSTAT